MEKATATPFFHLNPSVPHNPFTNKRNRSNHPTSLVLGIADTSIDRPISAFSSSSPLRLSPYLRTSYDFTNLKFLDSVKQMHSQIIKTSGMWNSDSLMQNLFKMYLEFGDFRSASMVFFVAFERNSISWSSFLREYNKAGGRIIEPLEIFGEFYGKGLFSSCRVLTAVLRICANSMDIWLGVEIHANLIKRGFDSDAHLKCALMNFYANCWDIKSSDQIFNEMPDKTSLLWNEAIMVNSQSVSSVKVLQVFREMQFSCVEAHSTTISKVLQACGKLEALEEGKQIHGYVIRSALESNLLICNSLISMYSKNSYLKSARAIFNLMQNHSSTSWNSIISGHVLKGYLNEAWQLFHEMESSGAKPDIVSWNCLLSGHFLHGSYEETLIILRRMQLAGFKPNSSSITSVLQAISELGLLDSGKEIHCYVIRNALDCDIYVGTSLIDMYVKNDALTDARAVIDNMKNRNIFAWNSLISGYSFNGLFGEALVLLSQMEREGIKPDLVSWNGLISGYAMWGRIKEALVLIRQIKTLGLNPNVVSWTSLISGCSQTGNYRGSVEIFIEMQQEGIKPNTATISSLLRACAGLTLLQKGKEIHCLTIRKILNEDVFIATALIDMYCKSGSLENAHQVFRNIRNKSVASWNSMIMGFSIHSLGEMAIALFNEMCQAGIQPDSITFTALLSGCRYSRLIDEGWKYFDSMSKDYNIIPRLEHYSCMVDLLGRSGYLDEAWDFIQSMPLEPDASIWGALLGSCRIHKNLELAEIAAKYLFKLEPYNSVNYTLMMNLYSMVNRWEDVENLSNMMGVAGLKCRPGWSWIQIDQAIHVFSAEGTPHPDIGEIYFELYQLVSQMKKIGYVPDTNCVFQNITEEEKEKVLLSHSEKLAITYGLIKMEKSGTIRVKKNSRVCEDCHSAAKYMSRISCREILLKDGVRFHRFIDGKCSCNDYW